MKFAVIDLMTNTPLMNGFLKTMLLFNSTEEANEVAMEIYESQRDFIIISVNPI